MSEIDFLHIPILFFKTGEDFIKKNLSSVRSCRHFFEIFWNFLKCFEIFWNFLKFFEIFWNFMKFFEILWNFLKFFEIFWSIKRHQCCLFFPNIIFRPMRFVISLVILMPPTTSPIQNLATTLTLRRTHTSAAYWAVYLATADCIILEFPFTRRKSWVWSVMTIAYLQQQQRQQQQPLGTRMHRLVLMLQNFLRL